MFAVRTTKILFISAALLLSSMAFAQSDPDEDTWMPYEESGQSESGQNIAKPTEPAKPAPKPAQSASKPTQADESKTDDTEQTKAAERTKTKSEQIDTSAGESGSDATVPATEPEAAKANPAVPESDAKAAKPEQQDSAQSDLDQDQADDEADADSEYESEAGRDGKTAVFSGPMAMSSTMGCAAGSCLPDLAIAGGVGICAGSYLCAVNSANNVNNMESFGYLTFGAIFGGGSGCTGAVCLGPMGSAGAIVGAVISGISSERPWWLPVLAGGPGLLVGMLGSGLIVSPLILGFADLNAASSLSPILAVMWTVGTAAAFLAGPLSMGGIIIADTIWGGSQQSENDHMSNLPKPESHRAFIANQAPAATDLVRQKVVPTTTKQAKPSGQGDAFIAAY